MIFESINHNFQIKVPENYGFSQAFLKLISILIQNLESCIIKGGKMTQYFPLKRGTWQGNPIRPTFLFLSKKQFSFLLKKVKMFNASYFSIISSYTSHMLMTLLFFSVTKILKQRLYKLLNISQFLKKKVGNSRYWCSKRGPNSTLWYGMCKLKN